MESVFLFPDRPALSLLVLWLISVIVLWAAREPMLQVLKGLGKSTESGLRSIAQWCTQVSSDLRARIRESLLAEGVLDIQNKLEREFHRVDSSFAEKLGSYA